MKIEVKKYHFELMLEELQETIIAIESVEEYYKKSIINVNEMKIRIESEYEIGLLIDGKLKECLNSNKCEDMDKALEEINNFQLESGNRIKDLLTIQCRTEGKKPIISYIVNNVASTKSKYYDPKNSRRQHNKIRQYENILLSSTLSNVIIIFERHLANIYKHLIIFNHKRYFENKTIAIANIFDKSLNDIIVDCVKNEIESNMFDSIKTLNMICQKEKIDINRYVNIQNEFEEIYFRRNLFIHNDGVINNIYLSNIKDAYKINIKEGDKLETKDDYLQHSINALYRIVCTLFYEVQNKLNDTDEKWISGVANIGFELLQKRNYEVAEHIYLILSSNQKLLFKEKAMYKINYINALKQQNKEQDVKKELESLDVSIATQSFIIAKLCLEDKNEDVYNLLGKTYPDSFEAAHIRDWPLFINFRETPYYKKFVKEHQSDFGLFVFEFSEDEKDCAILS